jgi:hypothetical protein
MCNGVHRPEIISLFGARGIISRNFARYQQLEEKYIQLVRKVPILIPLADTYKVSNYIYMYLESLVDCEALEHGVPILPHTHTLYLEQMSTSFSSYLLRYSLSDHASSCRYSTRFVQHCSPGIRMLYLFVTR